jgi:hypothetical protein
VDPKVEKVEAAIAAYCFDSAGDCPMVMSLLGIELEPGNVDEMLKLIARYPNINREFWRQFNQAPRADEDWEKFYVIASDSDVAALSKARYRRVVEILRGHLDPVAQRRNQLFR